MINGKYIQIQEKLQSSRTIIDLGCGNNPIEGATAAVDYFIEAEHRSFGHGSRIDVDNFKRLGIKFVNQRIDVDLPFDDKEFDFAYSHHAFEHVDDPAIACKEMMRIAKAGVIITPSIFSELAFGRPYHKWLVIDGDDSILFFAKRPEEDRPFGEHPRWDENKGWIADSDTNPFDIALNDGEWYHEKICEEFERLRRTVRFLWYSHSHVVENIFLWENSFSYTVIEKR